jgi:hypothetical protein
MKSFVKVPNKRILLTEEDFKTLVSGNILVKDDVEIALQDIGYHNMIRIIERLQSDMGGGNIDLDALRGMLEL